MDRPILAYKIGFSLDKLAYFSLLNRLFFRLMSENAPRFGAFFLGQKTDFYCVIFRETIYALIITLLLHKLNLLYFEITLHKTRKNFENQT
jgi:hypothetical protein